MKKIRTTVAFAALTFAGSALLATAPAALAATAIVNAQETPSAQEVLDRYIEVTGGEEAYRAVTSRVTNLKIDFVGQGVTGDIVVREKAPNLTVQSAEIAELGQQSRGYDGETAWSMSTMEGPRVLEGEELAATIRDADFYAELNTAEHYSSVEVAAKEDFEGAEAYKLVFTPRDGGSEETRYYSVEPGLLLGSANELSIPQGQVSLTTTFGDYRVIGGVKIPHTIEVSVMGTIRRITVESVEQNVDIPAEEFAPPEDVRAIME